jgi:transposase
LLAGGMVKENTQMEPLLRMKKIKLKLNSIQIKTLQIWNYHHRYTYNKTISLLNEDTKRPLYKGVKPENSNTYYSKLELRNLIVPESSCSRIKWILNTPKAIRESAVFESYKNLQSAISNLKNGHIKYFNLRYKSKKLLKWTIGIPKESIKVYQNGDLGIYEERTTNFRLRTTEKIKEITNDCTIHFDGVYYYICVPKTIQMKRNDKSNWVCSLDPGIRKFQTIYSPDNDSYITIGEKASSVLYSHLLKLDKLLSKKNSKNILKIKRLRLRIQYLQDELHYKSINFLCKNYKNIYIPKLTKGNDIIKCSNRKISSKTVRNMVVLGHCKFIERLKTKAEEFTNVKIHIITEEYTSQRCLACNTFTKTKAEMFTCKSCNFTIDRDILGSTNILLKNW